MAHLGMSDDEMTTFIKDGFGVDSSYSAKDLFEAAELPSWLSVCTVLGLSSSAGLQLQNALLKAIRATTAPGGKRKATELALAQILRNLIKNLCGRPAQENFSK